MINGHCTDIKISLYKITWYCKPATERLKSSALRQLKTADFENTFAPGCVVVFLNDYNIVPNKSCLFGNSIFQDRYRIFDGVFQCCH